MSDKTGIEWTDATWNPVTGCTKVSAGCKHCYAEREWPRMTRLVPAYAGRDFADVRTHADRLDQPLRWRRPRKVFVNSMSDLFHPDVPDEFIDKVFAVMAMSGQHTFQVLTKRPERMREYLEQRTASMSADDWLVSSPVSEAARFVSWECGDPLPGNAPLHLAGNWPLSNVWLGVSIEDQTTADERIPLLLDTPAAVRWISAEPLLGPVDLRHLNDGKEVNEIDSLKPWTWEQEIDNWRDTSETWEEDFSDYYGGIEVTDAKGPIHNKIDWVVVGGESGPKARPMHPSWVRSMRDQCSEAGVPFLFKQWGEWAPGENCGGPMTKTEETADWFAEKWSFGTMTPKQSEECHIDDEPLLYRCGKKRAGRLLDGVQHDGYPVEKIGVEGGA